MSINPSLYQLSFCCILSFNSATQLVLRVHKEAINNLSGSSSAKVGTVATVVAAANSTAMEASKEIEAAMRISMRAALGLVTNKANDGQLDDLTIVKVSNEMIMGLSGRFLVVITVFVHIEMTC